ncbi:MAG: F0F1 ATP synthase subunit B [Oscillatoriales cyanobacterium SM2_2_1]|nr:F0F1 ATP synthase subunit B [Oscillatoriales cyanobacterium SM2_2_1]
MNFLLLATVEESGGITLNSDILETNLINLLIVLAILFYAGKKFLGKVLTQRRAAIESAIQEATQRQQRAAETLADEQKKLAETQRECERLRSQAEADAQRAREAILAGVSADIEKLRAAANLEISTEQERTLVLLRQQVAAKALAEVRAYLAQGLNDHQARVLIDRSIALLSQ